MKQFAIGCFGVVVVLAVAGLGVVWFKFGDDISAGLDAVQGASQLATELEELNDSVENRASFDPPEDGVVAEESFNRFLATQRQMRARMEGRLEQLQHKYEAMEQKLDQRGDQAGIGEMMGAYSDLAELLIEAKRAQVAALNAHEFSLQEYTWVRAQVYRALGESVAVAVIGDNGSLRGADAAVPEPTREMVAPHRDELMQAHALAWWGL